jgi:hypothetical protein
LAALELLEFWAFVSGLLASGVAPSRGEGRRACISCRAMLMRLRRPCSAILWEVRFEVRLVEREVG